MERRGSVRDGFINESNVEQASKLVEKSGWPKG
jgi:hypothetical protein